MPQSLSYLCSDSSPDNSEMPVAQLTAEGHSHSELRTEPELGPEMLSSGCYPWKTVLNTKSLPEVTW